MLDYASISEDRRSHHPDEDWYIWDKSEPEPIHSHRVRELTRQKEGSHSLCPSYSSALKSETLDGSTSTSSITYFSTTSTSSDLESEVEDSGIFEFELWVCLDGSSCQQIFESMAAVTFDPGRKKRIGRGKKEEEWKQTT